MSEDTRKTVFEEEAGQTLIEDGIIRLVTFDTIKEEIVRWIHSPAQYRDIIEKVLKDYADFLGSDSEVQVELVFDSERDRYLLVEAGWQDGYRIYGTHVARQYY